MQGVESSSIEYNPPVLQKVESSSMECNTFVSAKLFIVNKSNDVKLHGNTMIKANKYFFKPVIAISKHMKTFDFGKDYLMV